MSNIKLFEEKKVCSHWNAEREVWYFSIVDAEVIINCYSQ